MPALRAEALYGDRVVRCFTERPASLHAMFEHSRALRPQHDASVFEGRRWSYAQVGDEADRLSAAFAAQGIAAGERVMMLLCNRPEFLTVLLALQRLGAIAVPVGVREQRPGLAYIANQCGAVAIVFDDELAGRVPGNDDSPALSRHISANSLATLVNTTQEIPPVAHAKPMSP